MSDAISIIGVLLGVLSLVLTTIFGVIGVAALWSVGALITLEARGAVTRFHSLLLWYVQARDEVKKYNPRDPDCLRTIADCHRDVLFSAVQFMPKQMADDIGIVVQKMVRGESIEDEFSRLACLDLEKSPLMTWVVKVRIAQSLQTVLPKSQVSSLVLRSLELLKN